ncbi:MAG: endonuclease III [Crenarchaeota archaeon]|nr:endonuclease III [Thermoproteota archaeon]
MEPRKAWARNVWDRLLRTIEIQKGQFIVDYVDQPFGLLIAIILSQNTADRNSIKALFKLKESIGLDPEKIHSSSVEKIEEAIYPAGLYKRKAKIIKNLAREVVNGFDLKKITMLDTEDARRALLNIEGIGKKTADVFLALNGKKIMGVDVHATRIAMRWGIAKKRSYDDIQKAYLELFDFVENYDYLHRLLITLGRKYCKARNPNCGECPIQDLCPKNLRS